MAIDFAAKRAELEALLTDQVKVTRQSGTAGAPAATTVYEGPGALLSTHGQIVVREMVGTDWLSESSAWYQLLTPLTAPVFEPGDLVEVTASADGSSATRGRIWFVEARTQASTWELARVTRLDEQGGTLGMGL
jgi:hypothetical protein